MNGEYKHNAVAEDMFYNAFKEFNPLIAANVKRISKEIGYEHMMEFVLCAIDYYRATVEKKIEKDGIAVVEVVLKTRETLERLILTVGETNILIPKAKGLCLEPQNKQVEK